MSTRQELFSAARRARLSVVSRRGRTLSAVAPVVASVPARHPYVAHLSAPGSQGPHRLPDPDPDDPSRPAGQRWWPPAMLEPAWVRTHAFDLMHVHFGFDPHSPSRLRELTAALRETGRPLVLTVHDLRNPHQEDAAVLDAQLDELVPAATALVTLTPTAADIVARRWGRRAEVVPHPHVVDLATIDVVRRRRRADPVTASGSGHVGVALKGLRTNTDGTRLLPALAALSERGHRVTVTVHRDVLERDDERARSTAGALRAAERRGEIDLVVHDELDDDALWAWIATLDVAVLPYRFGTHSGWLEMCHDLATSVVAPGFGCYADQGADATYDADETSVGTASIVTAVEQALAQRVAALPGLDAQARAAQRRQVAAAHDRVYAAALDAMLGAA